MTRATIQSATPGTRYANLCATCMIAMKPMILTGYTPGGADACNQCGQVTELAICKVLDDEEAKIDQGYKDDSTAAWAGFDKICGF